MQRTQMGELNVFLTGGSDREGGGDGPVVVLLHGFGAPGSDLVTLWRVLDVPREVRFVFPEAPLAPPEFADFGGRAWWSLDMAAMQAAAARGEQRERSREHPAGLDRARDQLNGMLDVVERALGVGGESIVLGGFSQGAMLSCDLALRSERALGGLALLSTTLICRDEWLPLMPARASLPILQVHGRNDGLLPFAAAVELRDLLRAAGCKLDWIEFNGAHEVPSAALDGLSRLIRNAVVREP
jgi:phospholipase/carboxylesterase